jgi:hypothetical protein
MNCLLLEKEELERRHDREHRDLEKKTLVSAILPEPPHHITPFKNESYISYDVQRLADWRGEAVRLLGLYIPYLHPTEYWKNRCTYYGPHALAEELGYTAGTFKGRAQVVVRRHGFGTETHRVNAAFDRYKIEKRVKYKAASIHLMASIGESWLSVGIDIPDIECHSKSRVSFWTPEKHEYDVHHLYDVGELTEKLAKAY